MHQNMLYAATLHKTTINVSECPKAVPEHAAGLRHHLLRKTPEAAVTPAFSQSLVWQPDFLITCSTLPDTEKSRGLKSDMLEDQMSVPVWWMRFSDQCMPGLSICSGML